MRHGAHKALRTAGFRVLLLLPLAPCPLPLRPVQRVVRVQCRDATVASLDRLPVRTARLVNGPLQMDGKTVHFQSQNHGDKKHLKLTGDGTIECTGGKGPLPCRVLAPTQGIANHVTSTL